MFPGMGGMNPKKMGALMKQMGIHQEEIDASQVIIKKSDGGQIIIDNPSVTKIKMQGQESFQITGDVSGESSGEIETEESEEEMFSEDDIKTVMEKTGCTHDQAKEVLESVNGDLAEAIMELNG